MDRQQSRPSGLVGDDRQPPVLERQLLRAILDLWKRKWVVELAACMIIGLLALLLFISHTSSTSLWYDETYSLAISSLPVSLLLKAQQTNMILYYMLLYDWVRLLKVLGIVPLPLVARLPSILAMTLAGIVTFLLGSRFWNIAAAAVAGLLFVLDGLILEEAQQARGYALAVLFVCLAWYALLLALRNPGQRRLWVIYTGMSVLGIYAELVTTFVVIAQVLAVAVLLVPAISRRVEDFPELISNGWRAYVRPAGIAFLSTGLLCIPLAIDSINHHGNITWVPVATPAALWAFLLSLTENALGTITLLVAIATGALLGLTTRRGLPIILIIWGVVPLAIQYLLTQPYHNAHLFFPRYLVATVPALLLLAAIGVTSLRPYWGAIGLSLAMLVVMSGTPSQYYAYAEVQPFSETTHWMEMRYKTGDGIICRPDINLCGLPIGYYLDYLYTGPETMPTDFPGMYIWSHHLTTPTQGAALTSYLHNHQRIFVFTVAPIGSNPRTVQDSVPAALKASGYSLVATYRPATHGDGGDVEVQEYSR